MTRPILVALDPAAPSPEAERLGLALARATGTGVILAGVFPILPVHARVDAHGYEGILRAETGDFLSERAGELRRTSPEIEIATRATGSYSAGHGLHRLAVELEVSLVVVGPSRRGRAGHVLPGTMAARFAHGAPCAVAVAPRAYTGSGLGRIGIAFTATDDGRAALRAAASLAGSAGASLRVVSVASTLPWMDLVEPGFDGDTLQEHYRRHVADQLDQAVAELPEGIAVEAETLAGDPVELLAAEAEDLDLLVCGSRGYGPVGAVVLGSVSHALLEGVPCPVMVVPRRYTSDSQSRCLAA